MSHQSFSHCWTASFSRTRTSGDYEHHASFYDWTFLKRYLTTTDMAALYRRHHMYGPAFSPDRA